MRLIHLSLTNFRNFSRMDVDVPGNVILMVGANAQGKTSVLEAIYFLATFTSFHADNDRQLINFIAAREAAINQPVVARIVADFERGDRSHRLEIRLIQEVTDLNGSIRTRKEALLDGVKSKVSDLVRQFNAVLFLPQMLRVVEGSPSDRRRYINLALSQVVPGYSETLSEYNRILSQRNALLKQLGKEGGDPDQLAFWDENLTSCGAKLIYDRIHAIQEIELIAARIHHELTRRSEVLRFDYQPSYDPIPKEENQYSLALDAPADRSSFSERQIEAGFQEALLKQRREEIARGMTTIGPHRDELRFLSNGIDLGTYGSRGQVRTNLLTLKLAEVSWMKEKTGMWPVLLLDEVLAELDSSRRFDLLSRIAEEHQSLLTTTDLNLFPADFISRSTMWYIRGGQVGTEKPGIGRVGGEEMGGLKLGGDG